MTSAKPSGVFCVFGVCGYRVEVVELVGFVVGPFDAIIDGLFAYPAWRVGFGAVLFEFFAEFVEAAGVASV